MVGIPGASSRFCCTLPSGDCTAHSLNPRQLWTLGWTFGQVGPLSQVWAEHDEEMMCPCEEHICILMCLHFDSKSLTLRMVPLKVVLRFESVCKF